MVVVVVGGNGKARRPRDGRMVDRLKRRARICEVMMKLDEVGNGKGKGKNQSRRDGRRGGKVEGKYVRE